MTIYTISFRKEKKKQIVETCRNKKSIDIAKNFIKCQKPTTSSKSFNILLHYTSCDKYILVKLDETNNNPIKVWSNANGILPTQYTLIKKEIFVKLVEKIQPKIIYLNDSRLLTPLFHKSNSSLSNNNENIINNTTTTSSSRSSNSVNINFNINKCRLVAYQNKNLTEILKFIEDEKKSTNISNKQNHYFQQQHLKIIDQINKTLNDKSISPSPSATISLKLQLKHQPTITKSTANKLIDKKQQQQPQPQKQTTLNNIKNEVNEKPQLKINVLEKQQKTKQKTITSVLPLSTQIINEYTAVSTVDNQPFINYNTKKNKNNNKSDGITRMMTNMMKNQNIKENDVNTLDENSLLSNENKEKRKCRKNRRRRKKRESLSQSSTLSKSSSS